LSIEEFNQFSVKGRRVIFGVISDENSEFREVIKIFVKSRFPPFSKANIQDSNRDFTIKEVIETHENNYTLLRTFLASAVIYFHSFGLVTKTDCRDLLTAIIWPISNSGGLAVQSFFFLSGLFVTQSFYKDRNFLGFFLKRVLRIWPALFVCVVATALIGAVLSSQYRILYFLTHNDFYNYILSNSILHLKWNIDGVFVGHPYQSINGAIHTLPMEAKMYIVLACVSALGMLRNRWTMVIGGCALLGLVFIPAVVKLLPFNLFNADYSRAVAAMFIAGIITYGAAPYIRLALWQGVVLGCMLSVTSGSAYVLAFYATVIWVLLYLGQARWIGRVCKPRQDLSYGIYLYGWPCQQIVLSLSSLTLNPYALTFSALAMASLFAGLSWRYIEKPTLTFGHEISRAKFRFSIMMASKGGAQACHGAQVLTILLLMMIGVWAMRFISK
jgi:peptidoglycan/LPS O-acetylase OafA/YrhL